MRKKAKGTMPDAYDDSERSIPIEDAHRDFVYSIPSSFSQTVACYSMQMKLFSKKLFTNVIFLIILAVMPLVAYFSGSTMTYPTANENMALLLCFLPFLAVLIACSSCGKMLPREYHERTIYLSAPLPMYKSSMYVGKFLAGFTVTAGKIILAYGVALISCRYLTQWNEVYYVPILLSLAISLCAVFFYCAFAYMTSTFLKRGSSTIPFIFIFLFMTGAVYLIMILVNKYDIPIVADIVGYMPSLSCDYALYYLGGNSGLGTYGLAGLLPFGLNDSITMCSNIFISCGVNILLGIICLMIGKRKIAGRKI